MNKAREALDYSRETIAAIRERYEPLGAKVELVARDVVEAYRPQSTMTQRIRDMEEWLANWDGSPVKQSKVYNGLGMSRVYSL